MTHTIAGIGNRKTPPHILDEMVKVGEFCRNSGIYINSGHAEGADYAFERGGLEFVTAFVPWSSFNEAELPHLGEKVIIHENERFDSLVRELHPKAEYFRAGTFKLMRRNVPQILGIDGYTPVSAVVCYSVGNGGTEFSLSIARKFDVPILNMAEPECETADSVIPALSSLLGL